MKVHVCLILVLLIVPGSNAISSSDDSGRPLPTQRGLLPGESWSDIPVRNRGVGLRADTTWYGQYEIIGTTYYALGFLNNQVQGSWTFDRGTGPVGGNLFAQPFGDPIENGEGWSVIDATANSDLYWRVIDSSLDLGAGVQAPVIDGAYSLWIGVDKPLADALCWECGAGYGDDWCQRLISPVHPYNGSGSVELTFLYWTMTEPCFDGVQLYLKRQDSTELMLNQYPTGMCENNIAWEGGTFTDSIGDYQSPETYIRSITQGEIGGAQDIQIIFEFDSDAKTSDEDCRYETIQGPFGADDIAISGGGINESSDFEDGTFQGWSRGICDPIGDFVDIVDVAFYTILDPCACELEGNILECHAGPAGPDANHPVGQHITLTSPICWFGETTLKTVFMEFDIYADLPQTNGVLIRPGWRYYPFVCEITGVVGWSERTGQDAFISYGDVPVCTQREYGGTDLGGVAGNPIPPDILGVVAVIDLISSCELFGIDPCSGVTNATPLWDNLTVGKTEGINAPIIAYDIGTHYQDVGSWPSDLFDPRAPGPANVTADANMDTPPGQAPDFCGDSLVVTGPIPSASDPLTRWGAQMWWRVAKRAPFQADEIDGQPTRYAIWKERVADDILGDPNRLDRPDNPRFTMGLMDSVQLGFVISRNKFCAYFREDDDDFRGENFTHENEETEMIWDDMLLPGTRIEYFCTSSYAHLPTFYHYLPDTSGGFFSEFEILPGLRLANVPDCGTTGIDYCAFMPAVLYIDAYDRGVQFFIENALRTILNGEDLCLDVEGCTIPFERNWDRYDYGDPSSNWNAPFARGAVAGSNNGMTLNQILGYRAILLNFGTLGSGCAQDEDYELYGQWLASPDCDANLNRQYFHANGDNSGLAISQPGGQDIAFEGEFFLNSILGATLLCEGFNGNNQDPDCVPPDTSYCVQWLDLEGSGDFDTLTDIDAYGNYCPNLYSFSVFQTNGGRGNRYYRGDDPTAPPKEMFWAQVLNEDLTSSGNYRTAIDGVSWHHMTRRPGDVQPPEGRCPTDLVNIVDASFSEISQALRWGFDTDGGEPDGQVPLLTSAEALASCQGTWTLLPADVGDEPLSLRINRLYQNQPNPFNPRTLIRFSLAQEGPVELAVYDVNGRLVKTLVDGKANAGLNAVEWDGIDDAGHKVGSGVYWIQMQCGDFLSNKKMVILK